MVIVGLLFLMLGHSPFPTKNSTNGSAPSALEKVSPSAESCSPSSLQSPQDQATGSRDSRAALVEPGGQASPSQTSPTIHSSPGPKRASHFADQNGQPLCGTRAHSPAFEDNPSCKKCKAAARKAERDLREPSAAHDTQISTNSSRSPAARLKPVDLKHLSHSGVATFEKCRQAFEFKYLLLEHERFSTIEQFMGTCVHTALELTYRQAKKTGRHHRLSTIQKNFHDTFTQGRPSDLKIVRPDKDDAYHHRVGGDCLRQFYEARLRRSPTTEIVAVEHKFLLPDLVPGVALKGIIDLIQRGADGTLEIVDFKTGSRVENASQSLQLKCYALWAAEEHAEDCSIRCVFEDLRKGRRDEHTFFRDGKRGSSINALRDDVSRAFNKVLRAKRFAASPSILCEWCGFSPICSSASVGAFRRGGSRDPNRNTAARRHEDPDSCPRCGSELELREGRDWGPLLGCVDYPSCRYYRDP
jgi:hypothetical protein